MGLSHVEYNTIGYLYMQVIYNIFFIFFCRQNLTYLLRSVTIYLSAIPLNKQMEIKMMRLTWIAFCGQLEAASITVGSFFRGFWASL